MRQPIMMGLLVAVLARSQGAASPLTFGEANDVVARVTPFSTASTPLVARSGGAKQPARASGYKVLYQFLPQDPNPFYPIGGVFVDGAGRIFGTTVAGGVTNNGVVFELTLDGHQYLEQTIYTYQSCSSDGCVPQSTPYEDASGNVYATAASYGNGRRLGGGSAIELSPSGSGYTLSGLHTFGAGTDGENPFATFVNEGGRIFTTCTYGGKYGYGAIVAITIDGFTEQDVYDFAGPPADGAYPNSGLVADASGALYGTTSVSVGTVGTVFKFVPSQNSGTETVLYDFTAPRDTGAGPMGGVSLDGHGNIYGATAFGGMHHGDGTVYMLTPQHGRYKETVLHTFYEGLQGSEPLGSVTFLKGELYGTTSKGGSYCSECGTMFQISPSGEGFNVIFSFSSDGDPYPGFAPTAKLFAKGDAVYGTTEFGSYDQSGVVFRYVP